MPFSMTFWRCFLASAAIASVGSVPISQASEPEAIFSGQDLSGWVEYYDGEEAARGKAWEVSDGVLRCTGQGRGYVRTNLAYADYVLRLEWRWPEGDGGGRANSGVLLHVVGPDQIWPKSIEAQLKTGRAGDFASFEDARSREETVRRNPNGVSTGRLPRPGASTENPVGEWNSYEITARGDGLVLRVNGAEVNRMSGVVPSGGQIALQSEGHAIEFRNVTIESLPPAKNLRASAPQ
ncbi:hypothetical protein Mal64_02820 [Pseudobythopirellula maris]|uniref:3-keto-alpha-glucoside-1,2-lyase/3-keto-2-hydroxy-glucal hydratase domain-containing protein n=1 Tax=Pseudobythopirellula maris TaxID=2527991 RepID=A0A5C5ZRH5_9BACT|nr:DUF1080 domain-containing protein [Pseudobythopirellula maris]TWT89900.1 hypothetical protein Mal64_02820 [Pseudobythopirellula maris]